MKREGRQRGMIRTYPIISPNVIQNPQIVINKLSSPPTAGLFTKVSQKPTNHSKFTGKCGRPKCNSCHIHPASKSKDKAKGTNKLRSNDVCSNYKLITWGVVDSGSGLKFSGVSATGILDLLGNDRLLDSYGDGEDEDDVFQGSNDHENSWSTRIEIEETNADVGNDVDVDVDDDDDDAMSFCEVDLVWAQMGEDDEDWCIVEEI